MAMTDILLEPFQLNNAILLKNHIVMAPMTRNMANDDFSPTNEMIHYYERRADAGLIVTEGTIIGLNSRNLTNVPGIFTPAHIQGWKKITNAVHKKNGHIFLQLWHVGRVSHPFFLNGELPISSSETVMTGPIRRTKGLMHGKSRAATCDEISALISNYATAAKNAMEAGFDGIEIHGANGYLIDQFLHYDTNHRQDEYGGTPENMARFALEVVKACGAAIGYNRVGLRLSPGAYLNEISGDIRDANVFRYLLGQLNPLPIAYVHTGNFDDSVTYPELEDKTMTRFIRSYYKGIVVACGSYTLDKAREWLLENQLNLIAIGRPFIANPDLIARLKEETALKNYNDSMLETLI